MDIQFSFLNKKGMKRSKNQDAYFVPSRIHKPEQKGWLFIVADGLGGYPGGEIASQACCELFARDFYSQDVIESIPHWLNDEIIKINSHIIERGRKEDNPNMSTTLISLLIKDDMAYLNNVGDSRIYKFQNDYLTQVTEDHSVVWEYYTRNLITKDEIIDSRIKNLVTEALGLNQYPRINNYILGLPDKYTFLLCSDGLSDVATDVEIEQVMREHKDNLENCTKNLYKLAIEKGSADDITIVVVKK